MVKLFFVLTQTYLYFSYKLWNKCNFGAEYSIDEFKSLSNNELYNSVVNHQVINIKNISIDAQNLESLSYVFGKYGYVTKNFPLVNNTNHVTDIIKPHGVKPPGSTWHVDLGFLNITTTMTLLYGINTPPDGFTSFASTIILQSQSPFNILMSTSLSSNLINLNLLNKMTIKHTSESKKYFTFKPVITLHPISHNTCLLIEGIERMEFIKYFDGYKYLNLSKEESLPVFYTLLNKTLEHVCDYQWSENDLVIFDNRCLVHRAGATENTEYRRLFRIFMYDF